MHVFAEEYSVAFNDPVAIDLIGYDKEDDRQLLFVFECKRAYTVQKTWIFFKDFDPFFRLCRVVAPSFGQFGKYLPTTPMWKPPSPICSEGYEVVASGKSLKADQRPIFEAANQLCKGFLGFVQTRMNQKADSRIHGDKIMDCIFPVLVTTAELRLAEFDLSKVSIQTGNLDAGLNLQPLDWLVLKHPFSIAADSSCKDFRNNPHHIEDQNQWRQSHRECIYVVNSTALPKFLNQYGFRRYMHNLKIN